MTVYSIDPLTDPRWRPFIEDHPRASVFHAVGWLDALRQTYRYTPRVLTTTPPGEALRNGLAICEVKGWRGARLVSLPFSDHCEPLIDTAQDWSDVLAFLAVGVDRGRWRSVELRPCSREAMSGVSTAWNATRENLFHRCDLKPSLDAIYGRFHSSCIQRPIRRAEREGLLCQSGSSPDLLESFYRLLRMTRRRHGLPPQPIAWFRNLSTALRGHLSVRVASKAGWPVASILTISFKKSLVYKYGGSDAAHHRLGGMPFLFWQAVQDAKALGLEEFDLGRSEASHQSLATFKERLGGQRSTMTYFSRPAPAAQTFSPWPQRAARWMFERLPDPALTLAGRVLYKHFA